jgi:multidrug transporter EmrE-like cation transporter
MLYLLIIAILIADAAAMFLLKEYTITSHIQYFIFGILLYALLGVLLALSLRYEGMGIVNVLWASLSILIIVGIGIFYFHEKVTIAEVFGIAMVVGGVAVLKFCES